MWSRINKKKDVFYLNVVSKRRQKDHQSDKSQRIILEKYY